MSVVPKFAIGGEAKKTVTVDKKERDFNEEDYDKAAAAHIASLPDMDKEIASEYYHKTLKPNLLKGKLNLDLGGDKVLSASVEGLDNSLDPFNKVYSEQELKALPRSERRNVVRKQNLYSSLNNAVFNNAASNYTKEDADAKAKLDKQKLDDLDLKLSNIGLHSNYSTSLYGKEGSGEQGEAQARLAFAKAKDEIRHGNLTKWISNYANSIYGLDENDESISSKFKEKYGYNLKELKTKLNSYKSPTGNLDINWGNLRSAASVLGKELMLNEYRDPNNINNWKTGKFTNQVAAVQEAKAKADEKAAKDAEVAASTATNPATAAVEEAFTGIKNGLRYNKGQLYTGLVAPIIEDPDNFNYGAAFGNKDNYGLYHNGKRIPDVQAINYYNKFSQVDRDKLFPTFYQDIQRYFQTPSSYVDIGELEGNGKDLVRTLRTTRGTGGKKLADLTDEYSNPLKNGRLIAAVDSNAAINSGTPWTNHLKYFIASKTANGNDVVLPAKMGVKLDGSEFLDYKGMDGQWKREILGKRIKRPANAGAFNYTNHYGNDDGTMPSATDNAAAIQKTMRATVKKEGGTLRRYQYGGGLVAIGKEDPKQDVKKQVQAKKTAPITNKDMKNMTLNDLSRADITDLIALGLDTTSMISSLIPGGNLVSGVSGGLGTLASFGADWDRDGLDIGDIGRLGMGLALDATAMIPGAGAFGSKAKYFEKIGKLSKPLKFISKGLMAAGAVQSAKAIAKLTDEKERDNMTLDDWRSIASGLTMAVRGFKAVKHDAGKIKDEFHTFNVKDKEGNILKAKIDNQAKAKLNAIESIPEKEKYLKTLAKEQFKLNNESDLELLKSNKTTPFKKDGKWSVNPLAKSEGDVKFGLGKENARFMTEEELIDKPWFTRYFGNNNRNRYEAINGKPAKTETSKSVEEAIVNPVTGERALLGLPSPENVSKRIFNIGDPKRNFTVIENVPKLSPGQIENNISNNFYRRAKLEQEINSLSPNISSKFTRSTSNNPFDNSSKQINYPWLRNQAEMQNDVPGFFMPQSAFKRNLGLPLDADIKSVRDAIKNQGLKTQVYANQLGLDFNDKLARYYVYKKGGLIPKHQQGSSNIKLDLSRPKSESLSIVPKLQDNTYRAYVPQIPKMIKLDKTPSKIVADATKNFVPTKEPVLTRYNSDINLNQTDYKEKKGLNLKGVINQVDPVFVADYIRNSINNRNTLNNRPIIEAATMQHAAESDVVPVNTINRDSYYNAANSLLASGANQTSDAMQNALINRSALGEANKLRMQGDAQLAQAYDQRNAMGLQMRAQNAKERATVANANAAAMNEANNKNNQYKAALTDVVHRNDDQFANRWLSKFQQDQQVNKENNFEDKMFELQGRMQNPIKDLTNKSNLLYAKISNNTATDKEKEEYSGITDQFNNLSNVRQAAGMQLRRNPNANIDLDSLNKKYGVTSKYAAGGSFEMQMFKENNRLAEKRYQNKLKITDRLNKNLNSNYVTNLKASLSTLNNILKNK